MTEWVAPAEQKDCTYCHNIEDMADGSKYTYQVSRRMLQMTRDINSNWKSHVQETGVTCHTCHRGQPVPSYVWFQDPGSGRENAFVGTRAGQKLRLRGQGLARSDGGRGDLLLVVRIGLPETLTEAQQALLRQLGQTAGPVRGGAAR
jgi:hypothetical protein